eukprot:comp12662_c0_seq1/m.7735 comp12662_c0_seq1/g.7735  ORF comp12662_c0_seq1/g.7735 comp12662_c0_seq1/m.7735 type:complete len:222 (-) comp12662_c0_seq1:28-693(-)
MQDKAEFNTWLQGRLDSVGLGDDVFVEYIQGILDEASFTPAEKVSSIETFLAAAAELPDGFADPIIAHWEEIQGALRKAKEEEAARLAANSAVSQALANSASAMQKMSLADTSRVLSEEEKARRAALLQQYGYDSDDESEEEDNESGKPNLGDNPPTIDSALLNANQMTILEEQKKKREAMKAAHQQRVDRDKAALEADRKSKAEKKEARKKAAQKGERRR